MGEVLQRPFLQSQSFWVALVFVMTEGPAGDWPQTPWIADTSLRTNQDPTLS